MTTSKRVTRTLGTLLIALLTMQVSLAQSLSVNSAASELKIEGSSNLHDWEMVAQQVKGTMQVTLEDGRLTKIDQLNFVVVAESLESGKGGMDKNAYKALDTKKHKDITFKLQSVDKLDCSSNTTCVISAKGTLSIAGTTRPIELTLDATSSNNNIILSGSYSLKMTDFNVDPPKAMFGTITTADELKINFKVQYSS